MLAQPLPMPVAAYVITPGEVPVLPIARREAQAQGVEFSLIMAVIMRESTFRPTARRPENGDSSYGLMQLLLSTAREVARNPGLTPAELMQPTMNVRLGTAYLARQLRRYGGRIPEAIAAYNAGTARKDALGRFVNTKGDLKVQVHVDAVLGYLARYRRGLPRLAVVPRPSREPATAPGLVVPTRPLTTVFPRPGFLTTETGEWDVTRLMIGAGMIMGGLGLAIALRRGVW